MGKVGYPVRHLSIGGDHACVRSGDYVKDEPVGRTVGGMGLDRSTMATVLEILGGIALTFGVGMLAVWAGIVTAGVLLVLFGIALERFES